MSICVLQTTGKKIWSNFCPIFCHTVYGWVSCTNPTEVGLKQLNLKCYKFFHVWVQIQVALFFGSGLYEVWFTPEILKINYDLHCFNC